MKVPRAQRAAYRSLLFALCIVGFAALATFYAEGGKRNAAGSVRRALAVETSLNQVIAALRNAESCERGFLLTQDNQFLVSFDTVSTEMKRRLEGLRDLVGDDARKLQMIDQIQPAIDERLDLLRSRVRLAQEGRRAEVVGAIGSLPEKQLMERISILLAGLADDDRRLFQQSEQAYVEASEALEIVFGFLFFAVAGAGLYILFTSERQLIAIETSKEQLQHAYEELVEQSRQRLLIEAKLRQAQKLDALGHLASGVAHDFNNMLAIIVASLNLLRRKLAGGREDAVLLIDAAEEGAEKAARLARRLLSFSREQPLDPKITNINVLITGMALILQQTLGPKIAVDFSLADDLWEVCVDSHELENALLNLAVNAADAMPAGGRVRIQTENVVVSKSDSRSGLTEGPYVKILFADTGEGMTAEVAAKALEPFFTTKAVGKGTGLGLAQVHSFVKQSKGELNLRSDPGEGTSINLFFPRFLGETTVSPPAGAPQRAKPGEAILIVDDDTTARRLIVLAAQELGYATYEAGAAEAAIEILKTTPELVLLVTDVVLPGMGGHDLSREALFRRHDLRVLYITGYSKAYLLSQNIRLDEVLTKPFSLHEFSAAIRGVLDRKHANAEPSSLNLDR